MITQRRLPNDDRLLRAVASERRRAVLCCLRERETPIPLAVLAVEVAVRERETDSPAAAAEATDRISLSLYHCHVPKLADAGLVTYDRERDLVDTVDAVDLESVLELSSQ
jgi:hypothetical protein